MAHLPRDDERTAMSIGFTGTQEGMTQAQASALFTFLAGLWTEGSAFHHGKCVGADAQAHRLADILGFKIVLHPPLSGKKEAKCPIDITCGDEIRERKDYLERNKDIVSETEVLIACPKEEYGEVIRSGTWSTVRAARGLGRQIWIIRPDGEICDGSTV